MTRRGLLAAMVVAAVSLTALACAAGAQGIAGALPPALVDPSLIEARIAEVEAATDLTDESRDRLVALYRKAISNLRTARANEKAAAAYRSSGQTAPEQIDALRAARAETLADAPLGHLDVAEDATLAELERRLREERADLAAVQALRDDVEARLAFEQRRPAAIRERLVEADAAREAVAVALQPVSKEDASAEPGEPRSTALAEARRWELETRYQALSTEIRMLDQELLSREARLQLLEARRDKEAASVDWIGVRVAALEERILVERLRAAGQVRQEAERTRRDLEGMDPVLIRLSEVNAELGRAIDDVTAELRALEEAKANAERLGDRISADYLDTRDTLESGQVSGDLGAVLLEQLDALPDLNSVREQRAQRSVRIARGNARRLRHRAQARRLSDVEATLSVLQNELQTAPTPEQKDRLRQLATRRLELLNRMLETEELHLARARELDAAEEALLAVAADYEALLLERLVWLRTEEPTGLREILDLPKQLGAMLAPDRAGELGRGIPRQLAASPVLWAALLLVTVLLWLRRSIVAAIEHIAGRVGKPTTDSFGLTLRVLGWTVLLALPLPLLLGSASWTLLHASGSTDLSRTFGESLARIATLLFTLNLVSAICLPKGLAAVHFRWPERNLTLLRTRTRRLTWIVIPAIVLLHLAKDLHPFETGGTLARLAGTVAFGAVAWFLYRIFHPRRGVIAQLRHTDAYPLVMGSYWLWYPVLVLFPVAMVVLALTGYLYTVTVEAYNFLASLRLLLAVVLLDALALRWLLVVRRKLAYDAALERRRTALEAASAEQGERGGEAAELQFEEPEVDLSSLSDDTRGLIRVSLGFAAVAGLFMIWADMLPALRVLEDHVLWSTTVTVDGEERQRPITPVHLGLALLFAAGTWVLLTRLPALLEIVLLRRSRMSAADRYAVTTLAGYVVGAVGILLVLGTLGASWSQLQWMAAALSVGIGFGLQEIVANFVSGLIILFERPIRVGDTVTVGDTDGVVTRVRIRATTIRNFDRKELLVPNKEFITGRLLNWSLSDPVTRIVVVVGVAYGSDVDKALGIMKRIAEEHEHVVDDPPPFVTFDTFGDNALTLTLRAYVDSIDVRLSTVTEINRAINRAFADAGISIAFPQRDVHLDTTTPLRVEIEQPEGTG